MENNKKEMVRMELHIERLPEIFNKQAYKGGVRTIVRRNQKLEIGLPGMNVAFSHHEYLVLVEVFQMWHKLGRPESGEIYREGKSISLSEFTDNLYGDERKFRTGKNYRKRVDRWIKNLLTIPLLHSVFTPQEDGKVKVVLGSFTFLSGAEGILSKQGRYFDLSKIKIHPTLVKSLLANNLKPVRLDVVRTLTGDNETMIYRELDLILSKRMEFSRPLIPFCNDLGILYSQDRDYRNKIKKVCAQLIGKDLSDGGIIAHCFIEGPKDSPSIVALKGYPPQVVEPKIPQQLVPVDPKETAFKNERAVLLRHYEALSRNEKNMVASIEANLLKEAAFPDSSITKETCFFEAIERFLKQQFTKDIIYSKQSHLYRETTRPENQYGNDPRERHRYFLRKLIHALHFVSASKPA